MGKIRILSSYITNIPKNLLPGLWSYNLSSQIQIRIHEYRYRQQFLSLMTKVQKKTHLEMKNIFIKSGETVRRKALARVLVIIVSFFIVFTNIWQCVDFTQRPCSYPRLQCHGYLSCLLGSGVWEISAGLFWSLAWESGGGTGVLRENKRGECECVSWHQHSCVSHHSGSSQLSERGLAGPDLSAR